MFRGLEAFTEDVRLDSVKQIVLLFVALKLTR